MRPSRLASTLLGMLILVSGCSSGARSAGNTSPLAATTPPSKAGLPGRIFMVSNNLSAPKLYAVDTTTFKVQEFANLEQQVDSLVVDQYGQAGQADDFLNFSMRGNRIVFTAWLKSEPDNVTGKTFVLDVNNTTLSEAAPSVTLQNLSLNAASFWGDNQLVYQDVFNAGFAQPVVRLNGVPVSKEPGGDTGSPINITLDAFANHIAASPNKRYLAYAFRSGPSKTGNEWDAWEPVSDLKIKDASNSVVFALHRVTDRRWGITILGWFGDKLLFVDDTKVAGPRYMVFSNGAASIFQPAQELYARARRDGAGDGVLQMAILPDGRVVSAGGWVNAGGVITRYPELTQIENVGAVLVP